jgi:hypothetical protein
MASKEIKELEERVGYLEKAVLDISRSIKIVFETKERVEQMVRDMPVRPQGACRA